MPDALRAGVIISALFALVALTVLVAKTFSFGRRRFYSRETGSRLSGVSYVFGRGMMPWEKESARKHPLAYVAGIVYHAGIFGALITLFGRVFAVSLPGPIPVVLLAATAAGGACGLALLLRRVFSQGLRRLSCPDDYASNALVTLFVILTAAGLWNAAGIVSVVMFLYVPVGKIRHCFFFFYSRALLGIFFGRRSALPTAGRH